MNPRLEHANLLVRDIDATLAFVRTAFPEFGIRHDGRDADGTRWVHVGTDETYLALNQSTVEPAERWEPYTGKPGVNHLAVGVDDAEALRTRMTVAGYEDSTPPNNHPHRKRVYFMDPDGNDWEFVEYLSKNPRDRHDYETPDK